MNAEQSLRLFIEFGIDTAYHVTPVHYMPFIGRSQLLLSRAQLKMEGFSDAHFRSTSHRADLRRGFGDRIYLSPYRSPPILEAKLRKGFPHVRVDIPILALRSAQFDLCRYAVARTRYLKRAGKPGPPEMSTNGRYYEQRQLPVARQYSDMSAMLAEHFVKGATIEIQVKDRLILPSNTTITCFSIGDAKLLHELATKIGMPWRVQTSDGPSYSRKNSHVDSVVQFVEHALSDCNWKGNGLDFDRL